MQVKTPEQDGKKKAFRLGEKVEVEIQADYYFGGPVSNASVEVVVYQNPFYHYWYPHREYAWYYDDLEQLPAQLLRRQGSVIKRETIKTDATGKAKLTFDTPRENYNQDFEYRIEARVVDSSRREIVASDRVRVTRQRYYVYPRPAQNIYRPKDKVTVDIKALDANEQPVQTEGTVKVTRDYWWEDLDRSAWPGSARRGIAPVATNAPMCFPRSLTEVSGPGAEVSWLPARRHTHADSED